MSMIVVFSFIQNVYMWNQEVSAEDRDRLNEVIAIEFVYFDVNNDLVIVVKNIGSVDAHLIAVWIEPVEAPNATQRLTIDSLIESDQLSEVKIDDILLSSYVTFTDDFTVTVFTERGSSVTKSYGFSMPSPIGWSGYLGQLGIFRVNWFYSRYSSLQNPPEPSGGGLAEATTIVKSEDYVAFFVKLKNAWDHPCQIRADSFLSLTSIAPPQGGDEPNFYLVQQVDYTVDGSPVIIPYNATLNPIIIYPNETRILIFACEGADGDNNEWRWGGTGYPFGPETKTEGSGIQISTIFEVFDFDPEEERWIPTGQYFGQTISTQATLLLAG
jgi:hypothetical protein